MAAKNAITKDIIVQLKILGEESPAWARVAEELKRPSRQLRQVNVYKLELYAKDGLTAVVPGKVLGLGNLTRKLDVVAYQISDSAVEKIKKAGGKVTSLADYIKKNPTGKGMMILG